MTLPKPFESEEAVMRRAIELAYRGQGMVEPNPMVGAILVDDDLRMISEGWHRRIGSEHAEVNAINGIPGHYKGSLTLFVTLEPCNHTGRTPPCTQAIRNTTIKRVVIGCADPAPHTDGPGIEELRNTRGIEVEVGLLESEARKLVAPFRKVVTTGVPWVIAKWAMTLDGKIASRLGHSQWISSPESRAIVHEIRGRMDAVIVGRGTVVADDPSLTARPPGARVPLRVVLDRQARTAIDSKLIQTAREVPTLIFVGTDATQKRVGAMSDAGVQVHRMTDGLTSVLAELGRRECTNVLVEGGSEVLGAFFDEELVDEAHVFIATKIVGGSDAATPVAGRGLERIPSLSTLSDVDSRGVGGDTYISGRVLRTGATDDS